MTTGFHDQDAYLRYNEKFGIAPEYHDYLGFYITIAIFSVLVIVLILMNVICCCCSEHKQYWSDPDTGNRFASFLFVRSAKQKPMDVLLA